jgi:hypothetical protein
MNKNLSAHDSENSANPTPTLNTFSRNSGVSLPTSSYINILME